MILRMLWHLLSLWFILNLKFWYQLFKEKNKKCWIIGWGPEGLWGNFTRRQSRLMVVFQLCVCYHLRFLNKLKHPRGSTSSCTIPPPFEMSMASNIWTTSSILGLLLGSVSQHFFITSATEMGQHLGISGLKLWMQNV